MDSRKDATTPPEKSLYPQLWHACAGGMVQIPPVNSKVFYFPQGHAEHAGGCIDFGSSRFPPFVPCSVAEIKYLADPESDEIFTKITMVPLRGGECRFDDDDDDGWRGNEGVESSEKGASFAKTLTQSDANNGGGFSVPRYCAETIFPRLDYSAEPPLQTIVAKDVHGQLWKFRHIYRGTPRRHLLTTGWSNFVNQKKLVAGDSIVFLRADNEELCVGIRRAKRGIGPEFPCGWSSASGSLVMPFLGYNLLKPEGGNNQAMRGNPDGDLRRKVTAESVLQAVTLAAKGQPFDVIFYPRAGTPEFFVRASVVNSAMQIQWCPGMRFKMPFETEDASRISWFMGTISSVQVADPIHWPGSAWRLLQVAWDEPDLLQNVKSVSPWLVELVTNVPSVHLSPFSPPRKKQRTPPADFPLMDMSLVQSFPNNPTIPLCRIPGSIPTGIQGARHSALSGSSPHPGPDPFASRPLDYSPLPPKFSTRNFLNTQEEGNGDSSMSCRLRMGNSDPCTKKAPYIVLFGQMIPAGQQMSDSCSADTLGKCSSNSSNSSSEGFMDRMATGHCKVFDESDEVGRTLDLSALGSYEELYRNLADMFGMDGMERVRDMIYSDAAGEIKHAGDEPFSDFLRTAKRLTIPAAAFASKT
ncbi:hypothetical protein MLD38_008654 [Melastoma candidum]|uniref:Uncharacterized protein n=1 Tax=Melastoma candidum TaxID=119954 RepID=A0ACB9RZB1_9MYRT|nr:hypothetical protein MLD38_008654 [Melastoma candidum]